jgi:hypothetical protein
VTVFTAAIGASDGWVKFHRDQDEQPGDNYYKEGQVGPSLFDLTTKENGCGLIHGLQIDKERNLG